MTSRTATEDQRRGRMLRRLMAAGKPMTTVELARRADVSTSVAYQFVTSLYSRGMVQSDRGAVAGRAAQLWWTEGSGPRELVPTSEPGEGVGG